MFNARFFFFFFFKSQTKNGVSLNKKEKAKLIKIKIMEKNVENGDKVDQFT